MAQQLVLALRLKEGVKIRKDWFYPDLKNITSPYTYNQLYKDHCTKFNPCNGYFLKRATTYRDMDDEKKGKGGIEVTNLDTDVTPAVERFHTFFFSLDQHHRPDCQLCTDEELRPIEKPKVDGFKLLINNSIRNDELNMPHKYENPETGMEKLQNVFLDYLSENQCTFPRGASTWAKNFVNNALKLLYYVDGHYRAMSENIPGVDVPSIGERFSGYNKPEASKHKKRQLTNLSRKQLHDYSTNLKLTIQSKTMMSCHPWAKVNTELSNVMKFVDEYLHHLERKAKKMLLVHATPFERKTDIQICPVNHKPPVNENFSKLNKALSEVDPFHVVCINETIDILDRRRLHDFIDSIKARGLSEKCALFVLHQGGNKSNQNFLWKLPYKEIDSDIMKQCMDLVDNIKKEAPSYERRVTKRAFLTKFGGTSSKVALRAMFKDLTGDSSAPDHSDDIDKRFDLALNAEDEDIITDLRRGYKERDTFKVFFDECLKHLQGEAGVAVHERRHGEQLYIAKAISWPDLHKTVAAKVPEGTPVCSVSWLRYQGMPINSRINTAKHYRSRFKIKMMVQKRQLRQTHIDQHYCAASWRYLREFAIQQKNIATLVSMDDKHKIKVGEPNYPLAAAERGRRVIVGANQIMAVGDHDFSKSTITPSVNLVIDIPDNIEGSFYRGDTYVGMKDSILQPSSPLRHAQELKAILQQRNDVQPILLLYSDGGPDHRCTYLSVKLSMIALFIELDLDMLVALRTAPGNSWANPVERIMSIVNLGLQGVGIMRQAGTDELESAVRPANSMKEMREALNTAELEAEWSNAISTPLDLLRAQMAKLSLKGKDFKSFTPATDEELGELWDTCLTLDESIRVNYICGYM